MPLTAEYSWVESETTVQLKVPLKGQSRSKLDVFGEQGHLSFWIQNKFRLQSVEQ